MNSLACTCSFTIRVIITNASAEDAVSLHCEKLHAMLQYTMAAISITHMPRDEAMAAALFHGVIAVSYTHLTLPTIYSV